MDDQTEPECASLAPWHLRVGVDRSGQGLHLAWDSRDKSDGRPKLSKRLGESEIRPAMTPGSASGKVTRMNTKARFAPRMEAACSNRSYRQKHDVAPRAYGSTPAKELKLMKNSRALWTHTAGEPPRLP
jgi:hypothetical protein